MQQNRATNINFIYKISHQIQHSRFFILQTSFLLFSYLPILIGQDFAGAEMRAVDVAAAQHGGGGENDVVSDFQKLSSAFTGSLGGLCVQFSAQLLKYGSFRFKEWGFHKGLGNTTLVLEKVVYILDQVRALEEEILHKIELQGLVLFCLLSHSRKDKC
ncbi:uncharacterized protein [Glycine max]|uniref:uncharacterized protein isoform X2 n=1 Tax=Glycine max TaxID=3847 RepID=UPI001B357B2D|nr:uncharacterized protein LOC100812339 isoform X2 [Glycine max]